MSLKPRLLCAIAVTSVIVLTNLACQSVNDGGTESYGSHYDFGGGYGDGAFWESPARPAAHASAQPGPVVKASTDKK